MEIFPFLVVKFSIYLNRRVFVMGPIVFMFLAFLCSGFKLSMSPWLCYIIVFIRFVAWGPRVKLVSCKSALNPLVVYSTDHSKAVVPVLVLLFVALWFILRGDLFYVLPCVILFFCFSVLLALRLPRLGKRELILELFVRLFGLYLFWFVGFLFLLVSWKGCGLWLRQSLDFSLTSFLCFSVIFHWWNRRLCRPNIFLQFGIAS